MSNIKNLTGPEAVAKLRELVEGNLGCMFGTRLSEVPAHFCPMQVQQVDDAGDLWFFSGADSDHNRHLAADPRTQLIVSNPPKLEYLALFGETTVTRDRAKIEELWTKVAEAWFPAGKEDPNLTLLRVRPTLAHYWDTEDGKLVTYAKMLTASLTGREADVGVEGDIGV